MARFRPRKLAVATIMSIYRTRRHVLGTRRGLLASRDIIQFNTRAGTSVPVERFCSGSITSSFTTKSRGSIYASGLRRRLMNLGY